jgi:DNA-binding response OmpR family regulator
MYSPVSTYEPGHKFQDRHRRVDDHHRTENLFTGEAGNHEPFRFGEISIDIAKQQVSLGQIPVSLTNAEFDLLVLLAQHADETLSHEQITQRLKGGEYDGIERGIDNRISQLRKKLNDDGREPYLIKTVRNKGYVLIPGAW